MPAEAGRVSPTIVSCSPTANLCRRTVPPCSKREITPFPDPANSTALRRILSSRESVSRSSIIPRDMERSSSRRPAWESAFSRASFRDVMSMVSPVKPITRPRSSRQGEALTETQPRVPSGLRTGCSTTEKRQSPSRRCAHDSSILARSGEGMISSHSFLRKNRSFSFPLPSTGKQPEPTNSSVSGRYSQAQTPETASTDERLSSVRRAALSKYCLSEMSRRVDCQAQGSPVPPR